MIFMYTLAGLLALFLLYVMFLGVCALLVPADGEYEDDSLFYRFFAAQRHSTITVVCQS